MKKELLDNFIKINDFYDFEIIENNEEVCILEFDKLRITIHEEHWHPILIEFTFNNLNLKSYYSYFDIPIKDQQYCNSSTQNPVLYLIPKDFISDELIDILNVDLIKNLFKIDSFSFRLASIENNLHYIYVGKGFKFKIEDLSNLYENFKDALSSLSELL